MRATWILGCSAVLALAVVQASAQPVVAAKSGTISLADGQVFLDDKLLELQPGQFPDMKEKSVLRTEEGRAEVLLPPGMFLRVGENGSFRMVSNRLVDTRLELLTGSAVVEIDSNSKDAQVTLLSKDGTVTFTKGIYRFDTQPARLKVFEGSASVDIAGRSLAVSTGRLIGLTSDTASVEKFDVKDTDSLDHWSRRRGEEIAMANVSAAKRAYDTSWSGAINPCMGTGPYGNYGNYGGPSYALGNGMPGSGVWTYNPWYGMITYMPCNGMLMSPYGYNYWSPYTVGRVYYSPSGIFGRGNGGLLGGGTTARGPGYSTVGATSSGYSGVVAASPSAGSSASSGIGSRSGSTSASGAAGGSVGHGSAGGGGHGH
ncbi:MAG: hypothetical protein ACLQU1_40315 [Bryobacteraceae bacterium]